jgi:hypothetical protein
MLKAQGRRLARSPIPLTISGVTSQVVPHHGQDPPDRLLVPLVQPGDCRFRDVVDCCGNGALQFASSLGQVDAHEPLVGVVAAADDEPVGRHPLRHLHRGRAADPQVLGKLAGGKAVSARQGVKDQGSLWLIPAGLSR